MEWRGRRESDNVEESSGGGLRRAGTIGAGGLVLAIIYALLGGDPRVILDRVTRDQPSSRPTSSSHGSAAPTATSARSPSGAPAGESDEKAFVRVILADTEDVWGQIFHTMGRTYTPPKLVLYSGQVSSACGFAQAAMGPFYCQADQRVYLDTSFFHDLSEHLGAQGEFARAYVIAHEVGHHVQNLLGITGQVDAKERQQGHRSNQLSVAVELQADCFAGIWAKTDDKMKHVLDKGDIASALSAAAAVGDDRLQRESRGYVVPDSFTHGSSQQRAQWFSRGYETGRVQSCDTFNLAH